MFKNKVALFIVFIGVIFFIPNNVEAKTTVTMCNSGCDYSNFYAITEAYNDGILTDKDLVIEIVGELNSYSDDIFNGLNYYISSITIKGNSKEDTAINNFNIYDDELRNSNISFENISLNISDSIRTSSFKIGDTSSITLNNVDINIDNEMYNEMFSETIFLSIRKLRFLDKKRINVLTNILSI